MIPWLLFKITPSLADLLRLESIRYALYIGLAFLIAGILFLRIVNRKSKGLDSFGFLPLMGIFILSVSSNFYVTMTGGTLSETLPTFRGLFLITTLILMIKSGSNQHSWLILLYACFSCIQVMNIMLGAGIIHSGASMNVFDIDQQRLTGIYASPWNLSYSAMVFTTCSLLMTEIYKQRWTQFLFYGCTAVGVLNLFFTVTRGGVAALPALFVFWIIEKSMRRKGVSLQSKLARIGKVMFLMALFIGLCLLLFYIFFTDEFEYYLALWLRRFQPGIGGEQARWISILAGLYMFLDNPLTGVGWDRAFYLSGSYGTGFWYTTVHNSLIQAAAEGGLLGIVFGVGLFIVLPLQLFYRFRQIPGSYVFLGGWIAVFFYNMLASNFMLESHWDLLCFWILYAACSNSGLPQTQTVMSQERSKARTGNMRATSFHLKPSAKFISVQSRN